MTNDLGVKASISASWKREHSEKKEELVLDMNIFPTCTIKREARSRGFLFKKNELLYVHFDGKVYRTLLIDPENKLKKTSL